jgi:predicted ArsR family transcriptional regulator
VTYLDPAPDLPLWAVCRRSDPVTSHIAAAMAGGLRRDHWRRILAALSDAPASKTELADRTGLDGHQIGKRLPELERVGLVRPCGMTRSRAGRPERIWEVVRRLDELLDTQ